MRVSQPQYTAINSRQNRGQVYTITGNSAEFFFLYIDILQKYPELGLYEYLHR